MSKIIDIPYGTYLAYIENMIVSDDNVDLTLEIAFGEWRGYFKAKDNVISKRALLIFLSKTDLKQS